MPVIKSLKNPVIFNEAHSLYRKGTDNISQIVHDVTEKILKNSPDMVVGANEDDDKKIALKNEILKILDQDLYFDSRGRKQLVKNVFDFIFEYGQLQPYIEDEDISDIDGTAYNEFSIKRKGKREKIEIDFLNNETFETYCKVVAIRNGGILNENDSHSRVADLKNRLRINVSISPRNIRGPAISIRKHRIQSYTMDDLIDEGMLDEKTAKYLMALIKDGKSMILCGKGASGKTTLLRALINNIEEMERVLVVESDAEIYPDKKFCIEQRVKRESEGGHHITLDMLIKDGLTMSLDTYCVGEITGVEAYDFIKASNSGHRVLATIHANNANECLTRLLSLASTSQTLESEKTLKKMVHAGIDVIVFLQQFKVMEVKLVNSGIKKDEEEAV